MQQIRYQIWVKLMQMHQRYKCSIISLVCGKRKVCYLIIPCGMFAKIVLNTTLPPSPCPQFSLSHVERSVCGLELGKQGFAPGLFVFQSNGITSCWRKW